MSILDFFPAGTTPRPNQTAILKEVENVWGNADVIIIRASVGSGKSNIGVTIANWATQGNHTAAILTHRVSLQDQYRKSFPEIPALMGKARYACPVMKMSCADVKEALDGYCSGSCKYLADQQATEAAKVSIYNYHIYAHLKEKRNVIVADEYHSIFDILSEMLTLRVWKHKDKYPEGLDTCGDVAVWLEGHIKRISIKKNKLAREVRELTTAEDKPPPDMVKELKELTDTYNKYKRINAGLQIAPANFFLEHTKDFYRGKEMELLQIRPTSLQNLPPVLWRSSGIQKIVLMSGTSSDQDIQKLGLEGMRIKYIQGANPIPKDRRPVDASWGVNMSWEYQDKNMPALAERIELLALTHLETKGLVHLTYGMAEKLKRYLKGDRYLWHDNKNREGVLASYMASTEPVILMACGMSEGLDLAGPTFGWQAIAKIPFPSMADKLIAKWAREEKSWYNWLTIRAIEQMTGRICRGPEDYGVTYILDLAFGNIPKKRPGLVQRAGKLFSKDFIESITWEGLREHI